jgi:hypothetical protein
VLRFLLWRLLGLIAVVMSFALVAWFMDGGPGRLLRGGAPRRLHLPGSVAVELVFDPLRSLWHSRPVLAVPAPAILITTLCLTGVAVVAVRWRARAYRRYVRLEVEPYRTDHATADALVAMFEALHKRLLQRWWRRLLTGQPSVALEVHHTVSSAAKQMQPRDGAVPMSAWLAVACPRESREMVEAALRAAYPNCRVSEASRTTGRAPTVLRLKKRFEFIKRVAVLDHFAQRREPPMNRLITAMGACGESAFVQIAMTPAPASFERFARHCYKQHEAHLSRARREHVVVRDRSMVDDAELRGGLDVQHRPLFFVDLRVVAAKRGVCERIASELRAHNAENSLVERGTTIRHGSLGLYSRRVQRGEGNPVPSFRKGVFACTELAALWQLPSIDYATVPLSRAALPLAPAPPAILRAPDGEGALRDAVGAVSIHVEMRKQNTAVPGTVEQGKSSYLVATVAEDLRRERCAVIVLDPKGDAADAAVSLVSEERTCTLLDLSHPTCGFNPLAVDAPADVIADYVVGALKNLFTDVIGIVRL